MFEKCLKVEEFSGILKKKIQNVIFNWDSTHSTVAD